MRDPGDLPGPLNDELVDLGTGKPTEREVFHDGGVLTGPAQPLNARPGQTGEVGAVEGASRQRQQGQPGMFDQIGEVLDSGGPLNEDLTQPGDPAEVARTDRSRAVLVSPKHHASPGITKPGGHRAPLRCHGDEPTQQEIAARTPKATADRGLGVGTTGGAEAGGGQQRIKQGWRGLVCQTRQQSVRIGGGGTQGCGDLGQLQRHDDSPPVSLSYRWLAATSPGEADSNRPAGKRNGCCYSTALIANGSLSVASSTPGTCQRDAAFCTQLVSSLSLIVPET